MAPPAAPTPAPINAPFLTSPAAAPMAAPLPAPTAAPVSVPQPTASIATRDTPTILPITPRLLTLTLLVNAQCRQLALVRDPGPSAPFSCTLELSMSKHDARQAAWFRGWGAAPIAPTSEAQPRRPLADPSAS